LQQQGRDPFTETPERAAQIKDVASRLARFIGEAKSSLDIAIYDFRLHDDAATVVTDALRSQASKVFARALSMIMPPTPTQTLYPLLPRPIRLL
jgi:hypothetical protein